MAKAEKGIEKARIALVTSIVLILMLGVSSVWFYIRVETLENKVDSLLSCVPVFQHMPDATLNQADPVSGISYTVLDTVENARIIGIAIKVAYTTVPNVECHINVDGNNLTASKYDMMNSTWYMVRLSEPYENPVYSIGTHGSRAFLLEGRSISITVEFTGGSGVKDLSARVKYAVIP